jgi:hypothetical protein
MIYNIKVDLGKSNVDSKRNVELRYTHVSAVKFTPELVEQNDYSPLKITSKTW